MISLISFWVRTLWSWSTEIWHQTKWFQNYNQEEHKFTHVHLVKPVSYSAHRHFSNQEAIDHAAIVAKNPNQAVKRTANNLCRPISSTFRVSTERRQRQKKRLQKGRRKKHVILTKMKIKMKMNIKMNKMTSLHQQLCNVILNISLREIMML